MPLDQLISIEGTGYSVFIYLFIYLLLRTNLINLRRIH